MKLLEDKIIEYGQIKHGNVVKVDTFLNHQLDPFVVDALADEFIRLYSGSSISKILTIESSGIAIAYPVASKLGVPLVFAKKAESINLDGELYTSKVFSFTKHREYDVIVAKKFLSDKDNVLIIDDFLANGSALNALLSICTQANLHVEGIGICIEKCFQKGGEEIRSKGYRIESLAMIESIDADNQKIVYKS